MATKFDGLHFIMPIAPLGTPVSQEPRIGKTATLVIGTHREIAGAGIEALLQAGGHKVVARCARQDDLLQSLDTYHPDIVMLAEDIVGQEAAKAVWHLRAHNSSVAIIFVMEERNAIMAADLLDLDVEGVLLSGTSANSLMDCIQSVSHGRKWLDAGLLRHLATAERSPRIASRLTLRESDIANFILRGLRNKEIAGRLHLSEGTVKMHLHHIYAKLRVGGRTQLALTIAGACTGIPESGSEAGSAEESTAPARLRPKN